MAQYTNANVGNTGDGAKIGKNVTETNYNFQSMYVNRAPTSQELRELQEKEQERSVYFLLFFT